MIKYEIYSEEKDRENPVLKLKLVEDAGEVVVQGISGNGMKWNLVSFTSAGKLFLYGNLDDNLGLQLDNREHIEVTNE